MIAVCMLCEREMDMGDLGKKKLEDFDCPKCHGTLKAMDLRFCTACGIMEENTPTFTARTGIRYVVDPGTTRCPEGHPFRTKE